MSHDQKPSRVRVVQNAATPDQRRRRDKGSAAVAVLDGMAAVGDIDTDAHAALRTGMVLPGAVFLLTAALGGAVGAVLTAP